jgi:hypothetical protein
MSVTKGESAQRDVDNRVRRRFVERVVAQEESVEQWREHQIERGPRIDVGSQFTTRDAAIPDRP